MSIGLTVYGFSALAGVLSTLSPCVLPLLPLLLASASNAHPKGAWALALGLALSFATVGMFLATIGVTIGLDQEWVRRFGAVVLMGFGLLLVSSTLQSRFAGAFSNVGNFAQNVIERVNPQGLRGQLFVGLMLGLVWSPCTGPTLGAVSTLASQGRNLSHAAAMMLVFGIGASLPLVLLGSLSRRATQNLRNHMLAFGNLGKNLLGAGLLVFGVAIATGWDKPMEKWLVEHSPQWLTVITTRY